MSRSVLPEWRVRRLKQEMLRAAVVENLHVINGTVPPKARRRHTPWFPGILMVFGVGLVANSAKVDQASPTSIRSTDTATPVTAAQPSELERRILAAPQAIDPAVFRLTVRTIVLDPGHGGSDPGAVTPHGLYEKELTLDIGLRLASLLRGEGYTVAMTRKDDMTLSLQQRTELANSAKADLFLSIHINFIPVAIRRGIETYYLGPTNDPQIARLATVENAASGYSLADFRELLERVYTDVRQAESRHFAQAVQNRLFVSLRQHNPRLEDRGVKKAPFVVLIGTEMPSILAEVSCISNQDDVRLLRAGDYRQTIARALASGVRTYASSRNQTQLAAGAPDRPTSTN
jgi:N-acetylmuramoyl-L-alanine amidase